MSSQYRKSRRRILEEFERLSDEEQEAILNSPDGRMPEEDAEDFCDRVNTKRVVNQTIDRYHRAVEQGMV